MVCVVCSVCCVCGEIRRSVSVACMVCVEDARGEIGRDKVWKKVTERMM